MADAAYDMWIDYFKWFADQADGVTTNYLNMDDVLIEGMKYYIHTHVGEPDKAAVSLAQFHAMLRDVVVAERDWSDMELEPEPYSGYPTAYSQAHLDPWVHRI